MPSISINTMFAYIYQYLVQFFSLASIFVKIFYPEIHIPTLNFIRNGPLHRPSSSIEHQVDAVSHTRSFDPSKHGKHSNKHTKRKQTKKKDELSDSSPLLPSGQSAAQSKRNNKNTISMNSRRILFLLAHPDDESMFYMPTIQNLLKEKCQLHFIYLTTGNYGEMGPIRSRELENAMKELKVLSSKHHGSFAKLILANEIKDIVEGQRCVAFHREDWFKDTMDPSITWDIQKGVDILNRAVDVWKIDQVMTFDQFGVSGHTNHIQCYHITKQWKSEESISKNIPCFTLDSVSILRKYILYFDIVISEYNYLNTDAWRHWSATKETKVSTVPNELLFIGKSLQGILDVMACHASQWVWFRRLFVFFSRYSYINTWSLMN